VHLGRRSCRRLPQFEKRAKEVGMSGYSGLTRPIPSAFSPGESEPLASTRNATAKSLSAVWALMRSQSSRSRIARTAGSSAAKSQ
jgi:hypothetical protein